MVHPTLTDATDATGRSKLQRAPHPPEKNIPLTYGPSGTHSYTSTKCDPAAVCPQNRAIWTPQARVPLYRKVCRRFNHRGRDAVVESSSSNRKRLSASKQMYKRGRLNRHQRSLSVPASTAQWYVVLGTHVQALSGLVRARYVAHNGAASEKMSGVFPQKGKGFLSTSGTASLRQWLLPRPSGAATQSTIVNAPTAVISARRHQPWGIKRCQRPVVAGQTAFWAASEPQNKPLTLPAPSPEYHGQARASGRRRARASVPFQIPDRCIE